MSDFTKKEEKLITAFVKIGLFIIGVLLMVFAVIFQVSMTKHFGGNFFPETYDEWITDIAFILLFLVGFFFTKIIKK